MAWWEMYEVEMGIAASWYSHVGFSQQPDCGDLLLSHHILNELAMQMVSRILNGYIKVTHYH